MKNKDNRERKPWCNSKQSLQKDVPWDYTLIWLRELVVHGSTDPSVSGDRDASVSQGWAKAKHIQLW